MAVYVAFLRAINLGSTRKFPKDDVRLATEAAGGVDVTTYLNTGNVRLTHRAWSLARLKAALEASYLAQTGFEVPTIVFGTAELRELTEFGAELREAHVAGSRNYVTLYDAPPDPAATAAVEALDLPGERCVVRGRAAYALIDGDVSTSQLLLAREFAALGRGTARTINVLRTVTERWC